MTDTTTELTRVLTSYADRLDVAHQDLAETIEKRYRRRTVVRSTVVAGGLAVVLVAVLGGFLALRSPAGPNTGQPAMAVTARPKYPVLPPFADGAWTAPTGIVKHADQVWPRAVFTVAAKAPDGRPVEGISMRDATHLVCMSHDDRRHSTHFYIYDIVARTFEQLPVGVTGDQLLKVAGSYAILERDSAGSFQLIKEPITGGQARVLATVHQKPFGGTVSYVDDSAAYWSVDGTTLGVWTVSLSGGTAHELSGFGNYRVVNNSGWAVQTMDNGNGPNGVGVAALPGSAFDYLTRSMRNLRTGQTVAVRAPSDTISLVCTPGLCIGQFGSLGAYGDHEQTDAGLLFIQKPDGSHRMRLPPNVLPAGNPEPGSLNLTGAAVAAAGHTYVVVAESFGVLVWDPISGAAGWQPPIVSKADGTSEAMTTDDLSGMLDAKTNKYTYLALTAIS